MTPLMTSLLTIFTVSKVTNLENFASDTSGVRNLGKGRDESCFFATSLFLG